MGSSLRERLPALNELYVLEIETGRKFFIPKDLKIDEPSETPERRPPRKYPTMPEQIELDSTEEVT